MVDIDKTCRTCMKRDVVLVDLFGPLKIENYCSLKLADILMETIPLQVSNEDGLPQSLCDECVKTLQLMFAFRNQALHSESELKKLIGLNNKIKNEDVDYHLETDFDLFGYEDLSSDDVQSLPDTENKVKIYNCVTCDKKYTDYEKYLRHISGHDDSSKSHQKCAKKSRRNSLLKVCEIKHCETDDIVNVQSDAKPEDIQVEIKLENDEHKCSECSLLFQSRNQLLSHLKEHDSSKSTDQNVITSIQQHNVLEKIDTKLNLQVCKDLFKCLQCNRTFKNCRYYLSHVKKHNKGCEYKCNECGREFSGRGSLKRHLLLHSEERPFKCEKCSKCFTRQDTLDSHMYKHSDVKKYTCEHCNKAFTQLCALKDHIRTHTGETPYLCSECGKGFKNSSNLRQHLARHSGLKPFSCNLCSKTFCTKGQVNSHMLSHTGVQPYKCNECGSSFTKSTSLKKHKLIHLGLKPFACDSCDMRKKRKIGNNTENDIRRGIVLIRSGMSIRQAAKNVEVPFTTLKRYYWKTKNDVSLEEQLLQPNYSVNKVFTATQEEELKDYINHCALLFYGLTSKECRQLAYQCATIKKIKVPDSWKKNGMAGKDWLISFKRRYNLTPRRPEPCSLARAKSLNKKNVEFFFENLENLIKSNPVFADGTRIFNLDETSTFTDLHGPEGRKSIGKVTSGERGTLVTTCCIISASGYALPPVMVFPRKNFKEPMIKNTPPGTLGLATLTGCMNSTIFPAVMKHFIKHVNASNDNPCILIMDNHESHLCLEALNLAKDAGVHVLTLHPHTSAKLQPLHVGVYAPFKVYYNAAIDSWLMKHPGKPITIYDLGEIIGIAFQKAMTPSNITKSFAECGIHPFRRLIFTDDDFLPSSVIDQPCLECASREKGLAYTIPIGSENYPQLSESTMINLNELPGISQIQPKEK